MVAPAIRVAPSAANRALNLLKTVQYTHPPNCPCHSNPNHHHHHKTPSMMQNARRHLATPVDPSREKEYAFEMAASSIRFGPGATKEVGMDFKNMGAKRVCIVTDSNVAKLNALKQAVEGLSKEGIQFTIYDKVRTEPKDSSYVYSSPRQMPTCKITTKQSGSHRIKDAIAFAKPYKPDAFLAVGGGSVIDTAKLMNLYNAYPEADFLDFVNAPLGKGLPVDKPLLPLVAVPTTAGTGSETTGTAIFDLVSKKAKTGIAHRNLKPTLGICDPLNTRTMPSAVHAASGLDVLCHSLESWTAIPYNERTPYLPRAVRDPDDHEAQSQMLLAATLAGVGFGNAGVHLCHGMSYPISSQNKGYKHSGYEVDHPIIPHGVSVAVTAPAVFKFTAASNPDRHLAAAEAFGVDISNVKRESAGEVLGAAIAEFLVKLGDQPRGLKDLGFEAGDIDGLVEGTIPQKRVLMLAPNLSEELQAEKGELRKLLEESLAY
ncbi:Hydroxyacid-oxoacid transhydrogenase [Penicillium chermesinum]|nr:Hydroxyacid-oxoacid transhydrogenase [Penicillium chermesinum]